MKIEKFEVSEKENEVHVYVEIAHRLDGRILAGQLRTPDVIEELNKRGVKFEKCISESSLYNWRDAGLRGTWVFSKKTLDKVVKDVILEVEKEVKPKPVRKKRTRTSTRKKVSTGE